MIIGNRKDISKMKYRTRVAAIIREKNKVLLVKHVHPLSGFEWWVPPGGGLEANDKNIYECAIRETWEETGYKIITGEILYLREFFDTENDTHNTEIFLKGKVEAGELTINNIQGNGPDEHFIKEVCWIDRDEVHQLTVYPEVIKEDSFWEDFGQGKAIRYLGRQEG